MLDRTQAPEIHSVQNIKIPEIESYKLLNGGNVYFYKEENTTAFKIELHTKGGNINGRNASEVQLGLKILGEGTKSQSGLQVSEYIDSIGSFFELSPGFDNSSISIYGLKKYFTENVKILSEIIYQPAITEQSLLLLREKEINKLQLNLEKGSYISSVNLRTLLFENHPYGFTSTFEDISKMNTEQLSQFHTRFLTSFDIYISGNVPNDFINIIEDYFNRNRTLESQSFSLKECKPKRIDHRDPKFIQSSIKLGRTLFNRSHPDYFKFIVTNELLGGFFGSRLMKNIREEKGFTYGIYSALYPLNETGYFLISTDVKGENEEDTMNEIEKELSYLSNSLVSQAELETVKNYMIGSFVNSFSAPFAPITKFKTVNSQNLTLEFYNNYIEQIRSVSPKDIQQIASQYLNLASLSTAIVGA